MHNLKYTWNTVEMFGSRTFLQVTLTGTHPHTL